MHLTGLVSSAVGLRLYARPGATPIASAGGCSSADANHFQSCRKVTVNIDDLNNYKISERLAKGIRPTKEEIEDNP
jgi:hypothetical protein